MINSEAALSGDIGAPYHRMGSARDVLSVGGRSLQTHTPAAGLGDLAR